MRSLFVASLLASASLLGCSGHSGAGGGNADGPGAPNLLKANVERVDPTTLPSDALTTAATANNGFAVDVYTRLAANAPSQNFVMSPVSAALALGMAYAGAEGTTASQMATALHFAASPGTGIADGQNALSAALATRESMAQQGAPTGADGAAPPCALRIVNSIWGEKTYPWSSSFLDVMAASYGTGVYAEDFIQHADQATSAINAWVQAQTNGAIYPLLDGLDPTTRMVLVNAVYLQLPWQQPFFTTDTTQDAFTRADGSTVTASFLHQTSAYSYVDDGQAQIVGLPLLGGVSAVVTLPHADVTLAAYEAGLTASSAALAIPASHIGVQIALPKVDFTTATFSLKSPLQAMGMTQAFEAGSADFTGMCPAPACSNLYVDDVLQKAMIQIAEEGVEAAAATAVVIRDLAGYAGPTTVTVNRPFLISLVDGATGAVLFVGHVVDPTASM